MDNQMIYKEQFKKTNILSLCMQILTILMILFLIFLPIYQCNCTMTDTFEFDSPEEELEAVGEMLLNGYVKRNFSLFEEIKLMYQQYKSGDFEIYVILYEALFPLFQIIDGVVLLFMIIKQMMGTISGLMNPEDDALLKYQEIKKMGTEQKKNSWMKSQSAYTLVTYAIFDIIFARMFGSLMGNASIRHMTEFSGVSAFGYIALVLVVVYFIIGSIAKAEKKKIQLAIAREELQQGQEQQAQVTEQTQA